MSLSTGTVSRAEHTRWMSASLRSDTRVLLVNEDTAGVAVGMCRFDLDGDAAAEVSINVSPEHRGRGVGGAVLGASIQAFARSHRGVTTLTAQIRPDNAASLRLFAAAGFVRIGEADGIVQLRRSLVGEHVP